MPHLRSLHQLRRQYGHAAFCEPIAKKLPKPLVPHLRSLHQLRRQYGQTATQLLTLFLYLSHSCPTCAVCTSSAGGMAMLRFVNPLFKNYPSHSCPTCTVCTSSAGSMAMLRFVNPLLKNYLSHSCPTCAVCTSSAGGMAILRLNSSAATLQPMAYCGWALRAAAVPCCAPAGAELALWFDAGALTDAAPCLLRGMECVSLPA